MRSRPRSSVPRALEARPWSGLGAPDGVDGAFEDADEGEGVAAYEGREMDWARRDLFGLLGIEVDDAGDDVALDELLLAARGLAEGGGGEAVDFAETSVGGLVKHGEGVAGEELAIAAGSCA